jgi:hypothetical protein
VIGRLRKLTRFTFKISKIPIVAILFQLLKLIFEKVIKRHGVFFLLVQFTQERMKRPLALLYMVYSRDHSDFCTYRQVLSVLPATFQPRNMKFRKFEHHREQTVPASAFTKTYFAL